MPNKPYDIMGIGYGPANISLHISLKEDESNNRYRAKFFERKETFNWHGGMLMPDTYMQVSFLKDLVTQRNPRSRFTYINFLHETGRLNKFINMRQFEPTRLEFNEYLKWVVEQEMFKPEVQYHTDVKLVTPNIRNGVVNSLTVEVANNRNNETETYITRNLVVATGGRPMMPKMNRPDPRVTHCSNFLDAIDRLKGEKNERLRFAVIGAGQSSVEMVLYLYNHFPNAEICTMISGFAFQQADSSVFVNEVFLNEHVDSFFYGNKEVKDELFQKKTNYAVVSQDDLETLYKILYKQSFFNQKRIHFHNFTRTHEIEANDKSITLHLKDLKTGEVKPENFDQVFLGTGFNRSELECMKPVNEYFAFMAPDEKGNIEYEVNRDYSIKTTDNFKPKVYVQGHSENQHGLTNSLLSICAVRAGEITESLVETMNNYIPEEIIDSNGSLTAVKS